MVLSCAISVVISFVVVFSYGIGLIRGEDFVVLLLVVASMLLYCSCVIVGALW